MLIFKLMFFKSYPAVRLLILSALFAGIIYLLKFNSGSLFYIIVLALIATIVLLVLKKKSGAYYFAVIAVSSLFILNLQRYSTIGFNETPTRFSGVFTGSIKKILTQKEKSSQFVAEGELLTSLTSKPYKCRVIVSSWGKIPPPDGSLVYFDGAFETPAEPNLPGEFNSVMFAKSNGASFLIALKSEKINLIEPPGKFDKIQNSLISNISSTINRLYSPQSGAILIALILGDRSLIDAGTKRDFSLSGTAHVLAVSGLHVGIIAGIIFLLLSPVKSRFLKFMLLTVFILGFVVLSGLQPSAIRAASMAIAVFIVLSYERKPDLINILSGVTLLSLLFAPRLLFSVGFQMSVLSVAGIALFYTPIYRGFDNIFSVKGSVIDFIRSSFSVTFAASITVAPLIAYYFGVVSLISVFSNLFVIPMMSLALILGIISISLSPLSIALAGYFANSAQFLIEISSWFNHRAVLLPGAYFDGNGGLIISCVISCGILYLFLFKHKRQFLFRFTVVTVLTVLMVLILPKLRLNEENTNEIHIIPRKYFTVIEVSLPGGKSVYLSERSKEYLPGTDYSFLSSLSAADEQVKIYASGNKGIEFCDKLKKMKKISSYSIDSGIDNILERKFSLNCRLRDVKKTILL